MAMVLFGFSNGAARLFSKAVCEEDRAQRQEYEGAEAQALTLIDKAGIVISPQEAVQTQVTDFGLGDLWSTGIQSLVYVNTGLVCAKELILLPHQTCPEHRHPPPGQEETFGCRRGEVYLYVPGEPASRPKAIPPRGREHAYTVWHEVALKPGQQHTVPQGTVHWFQAGDEGAVVSEFSSTAHDDLDIWTDKDIRI
jgi:D-lyxose ketol-isomerase